VAHSHRAAEAVEVALSYWKRKRRQQEKTASASVLFGYVQIACYKFNFNQFIVY